MMIRRDGFAGYDTLTHELVTNDHYPACPSCGDLCGKLARICASCHAPLVLTDENRRTLGLAAAPELAGETG